MLSLKFFKGKNMLENKNCYKIFYIFLIYEKKIEIIINNKIKFLIKRFFIKNGNENV